MLGDFANEEKKKNTAHTSQYSLMHAQDKHSNVKLNELLLLEIKG